MVFQQHSKIHCPMSICITIVENNISLDGSKHKQTRGIEIALIFYNPHKADSHLHETPVWTILQVI